MLNLNNIKKRAKLLENIREYFKNNNVLEVQTPLLCSCAGTDPYIQPLEVTINGKHIRYLQTSPEFAMKRLLAENSGSIFQISQAFRNDEIGKLHQPEFTMLEWYRVGFNHHDLMLDVGKLLKNVLFVETSEKISYRDLFLTNLGIDPWTIPLENLIEITKKEVSISTIDDYDRCLQLLLSNIIEPKLGRDKLTMIYDFPASQAALAKLRFEKEHCYAERFEVYYEGVELANGYHELTDYQEQLQRFQNDNLAREKIGQKVLPIDNKLLESLQKGMPDCAGVALGIDRLMMLLVKSNDIKEVLTFPWDNC